MSLCILVYTVYILLTWIDDYRTLAKHPESYTSPSTNAAKLKSRYRKEDPILTHRPLLREHCHSPGWAEGCTVGLGVHSRADADSQKFSLAWKSGVTLSHD